MTSIKFHQMEIFISNGDLLFQESDALICPCFDVRNHDQGICRQIKIRAGESLISEIGKFLKSEHSFSSGSHRLAVRRIRSIFHLYHSLPKTNFDAIQSSLHFAFKLIVEKKLKSVSMGSLNASIFKLSYSSISTLILDCLETVSQEDECSIEKIYIVDSNQNFLNQFTEALHERVKQ